MLSNELLNVVALAIRADGTYTPFSGDAIKYALEMTLLGMGMIFAVLGILWCVLTVFKLVFARPSNKKEIKEEIKEEIKKENTAAVATAEVAKPAVAPAAADDSELIAILTAAIMAYEAEQNPEAPIGNFRVVSYRRANGGRSWNAK